MAKNYPNIGTTFEIDNVIFHIINFSVGSINSVIPAHAHSRGSFELHTIFKGGGSVRIDDTTYPLNAGTTYVTGPLVLHEQIPDTANPMYEYSIYLTCEGVPAKNSITDTFVNHSFWIGDTSPEYNTCINQILNELQSNLPASDKMLDTLFQQLILHLSRNYSSDFSQSISTSSLPQIAPERKMFLSIERYFLGHSRDFSLTALAQSLNLSNRQVERLLKKYYGKTFQQKKEEARMSAALILLKDSSNTLDSIADEIGYSSVAALNTAFKHFYGVSLAKYRKGIL